MIQGARRILFDAMRISRRVHVVEIVLHISEKIEKEKSIWNVQLEERIVTVELKMVPIH